MAQDSTALIVIDLQEAMRADRDAGYPWANPDAPETAGRILAAFRAAGLPVVHVHHNTTNPADGFHPDNPLSVAMPEVAPAAGEAVVVKHGSSAFIGTSLQALLHDIGAQSLVIVGGEANMCVESTARMAGNLGFQTTVVADALVNFQRTLRDGRVMPPQTVLDMSLANLASFARITDSAVVLSELSPVLMTPEAVQALFSRSDGTYFFSRWGRPIVPVVFGADDATLSIFKGAIEAIVTLAGHKMAETDVELGANLMVFFLRDWDELLAVPGLNAIVPELDRLCPRLQAQGANQYRLFRFDPQGSIRAVFVFLRMDDVLSQMPAEDLALAQAAQVICLWSDQAFREKSPLAKVGQMVILRPEIAGVIRAAYDPILPDTSTDPSHALRIFARLLPANS